MFQWLTRKREAKSSSLDLLRAYVVGASTSSGQSVTTERALGVSAVLRCATVIGNGCSQIPFKLYRRSADGKSREEVRDHPIAKLIGRRPNAWQSPMEWRRTMTMHAAMAECGLSIVTRSAAGVPLELLPVPPSWVEIKRESDWSVRYVVSYPDGQKVGYGARDVFVLRGPSWDSIKGLGAAHYAREAIGLRLAVDQSQAKLFANGARPGGLLVAKAPLTEDQREALKAAWSAMYGGADNSGKSALLEGDLDFKPMSMKNTDAETMELRGQQIEEICMAFGVFPQMVGYSGGKTPTFASAEQFFLNHVVHTLQPWHVTWEDAMATQLLNDEEWTDGLYFKFTVQALMRGTAKERAEYLKLMVEMGALNPNEVRALEELDEKPELNRFRIPLNTTVVGDDGLPVPRDTGAPAAPGN